ncbi:MAG: DUF2802 domain-containing protein [Steroidobacteraceae bacterium]
MPEIHQLFAHVPPALNALGHALGQLRGHLPGQLPGSSIGTQLGHALQGASPESLLLAGRAAFLVFSFVLAAVTFTRWRRAAERDTAHTAQQLTAVIDRLDRIESLCAQNEPRLTALGEQLEAHLRAVGSPGASYPIAIRLAGAGAEPQELMSSCGLTRQEAELVARLHGRRRDPAGPARVPLRGRSAAA